MGNREILFRAQGLGGEWLYGYLLSDRGKEYFYIAEGIGSCGKLVVKETVGQFTGLTDKNGNKIFEGDLISVHDHYNDQWSIDSSPVVFSYDYVGGWVISNGKDNLTLGKRQDKIKITGNIHDKI